MVSIHRERGVLPCRLRRTVSILTLVPVLVASAPDVSAQPIKIVSMEIGENLQTAESPGLYGELIARVLDNTGVDYEFRVVPFRRALREFFRGDAECVWALDSRMLRQFNETKEPLIDSEPLFTSTQHVFMAPGIPRLTNLRDLSGKKVGLHYYSNLSEVLAQLSAELVTVADNDSKVRILINRRVDAIVGWVPDILVAFHNEGADPGWINPVLKTDESDVGIACRDSDRTRAFLAKADVAIRDLVGSADYREILDRYGAILPKRPGD